MDIVVIVRTREGFVERVPRLYGLLAVPVDMDVLWYIPKECAPMRERPFVRRL
ncbi:MAG: hypothetical protein NZ951_06085 [Dehalococcoidia bacterium]|nr:hypothetical protein [Dehalococcoidia bacterium]MDW8119960.1 hypothetical protein [Chloroflexota bacterium]